MANYFWTNLIFIICWIGFWVYLAFLFQARPEKFSYWKKGLLRKNWGTLLALAGLLSAPFIWVNTHQDNGYYDYKKLFDDVKEDGDIADMVQFQKFAIQEYPDNPRVNIEYMLFAEANGLDSWLIDRADYFKEQIKEGHDVEKFQLLSHLGSLYSGLKRFEYSHNNTTSKKQESLLNFVKAEKEYKYGDGELAQKYFIQVLEDNELQDLAYDRLESIWMVYYSLDQLSKYAYDMNVFPHMPFVMKKDIYIQDQAWGWYLFNGIYRDFLSADLPAYLAVGFSLIVWLMFISRMLFIKRDNWKLIIPLFILGAILPVMVYVLSDLFRYFYSELNISLEHDDFLYCFINIGMIEELTKTVPWLIFYFLFKKHFHRPVHFMLLPVISALGFAFSENLIYVNSNDYELVFVRSAISLIMHISCSAIIGYMAWRANLKRDLKTKIGYVLGGFVLASFLHGLFDFIIFNNGGYLNIIVLLITLHLLILFMNNAINFSGIKDKYAVRQLRHAGAMLLVGLFATFLIQYLIVGWTYAPYAANVMFKSNLIFALVNTIYLVAMFGKIRLRPRVLYKFSFADVFGQFMTTSKGNYFDEVDYKNCEFKLFAPKSNRFVGAQLPIKAKAIKRIVVQGDISWWLVQFEKPLYVVGTDPLFGVVKAKESDQDLFMDKVEVMLLMIPDINEFHIRPKHHSEDFIYTGRVYSRPLVQPSNKV